MQQPKFTLWVSLLLFWAMSLSAQNQTTYYYSIDYMKVKPGMTEDYLACEKAWKKIHTYKMNQGVIEGWALEEVVSPSGSNTEYNYVTRQRFKSLKQLAAFQSTHYFPDNWRSLLTHEEVKLVERTGDLRTYVKNEVWSSQDRVLASDMAGADIAVFNYFKMPTGISRSVHINMERSLWKPFHKEQVMKGNRKGWVLLNRELPIGSGYDYDVATVDVYTNMDQFWAPLDSDAMEKMHPNKTMDDIWNQTIAAGERSGADVRREIDFISSGRSQPNSASSTKGN